MKKIVGVLALQGDFREHFDILAKLGVPAIAVRLPDDLKKVDRLIIPGGESTTIGKLLVSSGLLAPIRRLIKNEMPVWGTCAGAILMAKHVTDGLKGQPRIAVMEIAARRNAFGRQLDSFETRVSMPKVSKRPIPVLFIRAPIFESPAKDVDVLARLPDGRIVAARQGKMLVTSFHPELAGSTEIHRYFLNL